MISDFSGIQDALAFPFEPESISWRVGSTNKKARERSENDRNAKATKGTALAYIDARDAMDRLDEVCGGDWQVRYPDSYGGLLICEVGIRIGDEWVWRGNGAGETQVEGEKGMASDAFKRAAVLWGVGRYLYALDAPWVDIDQWGKFKHPPLPAWATPGGWQGGTASKRVDVAPLLVMHEVLRANCDAVSNIIAHLDCITVELDASMGYEPKRELTDEEMRDLGQAQATFHALSEHEQRALWVATTKGGVFTTVQRKLLKM